MKILFSLTVIQEDLMAAYYSIEINIKQLTTSSALIL